MGMSITAAARAPYAPNSPLVIGLLRQVIEQQNAPRSSQPTASGHETSGARFDAVA